ncbi:MAG TPA: PAS domain-containing protein [Actinomycetota bacterium]|nr:PAS domain-containing protein [Actinomycetota bacterium]
MLLSGATRQELIDTAARLAAVPSGNDGLADALGTALDYLDAQERLRDTESKYRKLVEDVPAITYIADFGALGAWTYVSPQIEPLLGFTPAEVLADPGLWHRQIHPDDRERVLEDEVTAAQNGSRLVSEYRMFAKDGRVVWFRDEANLIRNEDDEAIALQGLMYDVTERREAERTVHEAQARYQALVEQVPAVVYTELPDDLGTCVYVSPQIEKLLGYTPEEWTSDANLWVECIHPEDRDHVMSQCTEANDRAEMFDMEYRMIHRDGPVVWVRDHAVPLHDEEGVMQHWHGLLQDVTAQKEIEARYRSLVEQLPAVTYVTGLGEEDQVLYVSPQLERLIGLPPEEWYRSPTAWLQSLHRDDVMRVAEAWREHGRTGEPYSVEYRVVHVDGRVRWVKDEAVVVRDDGGRPMVSQGIMLDITDLKLAEASLRRSYDREREAAQRLRALDEMKNAFLAAVSHELRTPLSAVLGFAVTLEQEDVPLDEGERREMLHRLALNARKLERLLSDLLDLDRLARGVLQPRRRPTNVGELLRRVVDEADLLSHEVSVDCPDLEMNLDGSKVERIVENLLSNATKHTEKGGRIWISAGPHEEGLLIRVDDEGTGVPPDLKASIFEPFHRGATTDPAVVPGTGIGLSLVARFAELHGGRAWVEDRPEGGSSFRVILSGADDLTHHAHFVERSAS